MRVLLKGIEDLLDALIHERYGAHLDANRLRGSRRRVRSLGGGDDRTGGRALQKVATVHNLERNTFRAGM
jgi:hypothetical protein